MALLPINSILWSPDSHAALCRMDVCWRQRPLDWTPLQQVKHQNFSSQLNRLTKPSPTPAGRLSLWQSSVNVAVHCQSDSRSQACIICQVSSCQLAAQCTTSDTCQHSSPPPEPVCCISGQQTMTASQTLQHTPSVAAA